MVTAIHVGLQDPHRSQAVDLLKLIVAFKNTAWAAYQADMAACGHAKIDCMRGIHDAVMLCSMFGWLPPVHVSMITILLRPDLPYQCLAEGCSCRGNRSFRLPSTDCRAPGGITTRQQGSRGVQPIVHSMLPHLDSLLKIILLLEERGGCAGQSLWA